MKKRVLMYRCQGDTEWKEYTEEVTASELEDYEVGRIYTYEYKVIEKEKTNV